jgi:predicted porin
MKKTLVALAALASVSVFAQVTLSGNFDIAATSVGFTDPLDSTSLVKRKAMTVGSYGTASTSTINLMAEEDLGGGLKSAARLEIDPRANLSDSATTMATHSSYVGIMGNFGAIKLGKMDSAAVLANGQQSPLGTGIGSGYGILQANVFAATRYNRSFKYESAVINGISGSIMYTPGNQATTTTVGGTEYGGIPLQRAVTEVGLAYDNGPLKASLINVKTASASGSTAAGTVTPLSYTTTATNPSTTSTILTAQYTMGNVSLHFGTNKGETLGTAASSSGLYYAPALAAGLATNGRRMGLKYTVGSMDFIAQQGQQKIETTTTSDTYVTRKVTGLRAVSNLSKTSSVYVGYEKYNSGTNLASTAAAIDGGTYTLTSVGIRKTF